MDFLTSCGLVIVTGFGGMAVLQGRMAIGELVACLILVRFLYEPIGKVARVKPDGSSCAGSCRSGIRNSR